MSIGALDPSRSSRAVDGRAERVTWRTVWTRAGYAPLDGRVRAIFYGLVLVVGARFFAVTIPAAVRDVPAELYDRSGLLGIVVDDRATALWLVELLRFPVLAGLVLAMVGLGGRLPQLVAGCGAFVMIGAYLGGTGSGHAWYVAIFAIIVLGLTHRPNAWSLDAVLARRWPRTRLARRPDRSAFGRQLILLYVVFTLVAGGVAKLVDGGWRWLDGRSIQWYLAEHGAPKGGVGSSLTEWILDHGWLAVAVSTFTIVVELGAVVTLFAPGTRLLYFAVLAPVFHLGIAVLMLPEFFPQLITYVLLVEWAAVDWRRPFTLRRRTARTAAGSPRWTVAVTVALTAVLAASMLARIEWYPLTNIPMYSSYVNGEEISGIPMDTFADEQLLCAATGQLQAPNRPWYTPIHLGDQLGLRPPTGDVVEVGALTGSAPGGPQYWRDELADGLLDDLACADGALAVGDGRTRRVLAALHRQLGVDGELTLSYRFADGDVDLLTVEGDP